MRNSYRAIGWTIAGLLLGLALGLYLGWVAWPTEFTEAEPAVMQEEYRRDYTIMIATAYEVDGDLAAARRRLYTLGGEAPDRWLLSQTADAILNGQDEQTIILPLVRLAHDLGLDSPAMAPYLSRLEEENGDDVQE